MSIYVVASLLIRISIQSIVKTMQPQVLEAKPESKFTPPSSQLTPFAPSPQMNSPTKSDPSRYLLSSMPKRALVNDVCVENNPPVSEFHVKYHLKPEALPDIRTLTNFSILIAKLPVADEDLDRKYSPDINNYTVLIGSCSKTN